MKERPILFSGPMVRALLDDSKTQTRRVLKQAVGPSLSVDCDDRGVAELSWLHGDGPGHEVHDRIQRVPCPYGEPGDRLWVRESFWGCDAPGYGDQPCVVYDDEWHGKEYRPAEIRPWARKFGRIPSIHMPRDCSRITLEVTGVRVERLQSMSIGDLCAEGIGDLLEDPDSVVGHAFDRAEHFKIGGAPMRHEPEIYGYAALWNSLNGAGSWDANPWVWVVEFRRLSA